MSQGYIKEKIIESLEVKKTLIYEVSKIEEISKLIIKSYKKNGKVLICGNGGSAADSQHFAAELVNKFERKRVALNCIALTTDTSIITSLANDEHFDNIFDRQVEALGNKNDVLISISTSGGSKNIINSVKKAKELGIKTVSLTGVNKSDLDELSNISLKVNSEITARIQESHILILHILCGLIEKEFCGEK